MSWLTACWRARLALLLVHCLGVATGLMAEYRCGFVSAAVMAVEEWQRVPDPVPAPIGGPAPPRIQPNIALE